MLSAGEYYRHPAVQERIAEYCGGNAQEPELCTAEYLVGYGEAPATEPYISTPEAGFRYILERGLDIFRSLWDRIHTLSVLSVEYFNLDCPEEVYFNQAGVFKKLEPVYKAVLDVYMRYGIQPLVMMTSQGYNFSFQIQSGTKTDLMLENLGRLIDSLEGKYGTPAANKRHRAVSPRHGRAFDGMGRVMEFLAHRVIRAATGQTRMPVILTDVAVGKTGRGVREGVSIDLSCFGDPIYMRDLCCAFSTHQKHKIQRNNLGNAISRGAPIHVAVPRGALTLEECLSLRQHFRHAADYAAKTCCFMPDFTVNFKKVIEDYQQSGLFRFHQWFDSERQDPWTKWDTTYRAFDIRVLPPCVQHSLSIPNDNLLKPTNLQTLTRCLLALGWHPQHIAGLVRSKWEGNYGWGPNRWDHFDAGSRSSFYVRLFAGLIAGDLDMMIDHNCVSHKEKGYCWQPNCGYSLGIYCWNGKF